ncbi:MAG TPA: hypothetical protein VHB77_07870, partial [Planctomycetaceae bacterium]|nr:hypothetical protein [Planctomycetaceae bacterium]
VDLPLHYLDLDGTQVTNKSMVHIAEMSLGTLRIERTRVTAVGLMMLRHQTVLHQLFVDLEQVSYHERSELEREGVPVRYPSSGKGKYAPTGY